MELINIEYYKKLISQNKSDQLCEDLLGRINEYLLKDQNSELQEIYDNLIMITGRLKSISQEQILNIISFDDAKIEKAKVDKSLLTIINQLPSYYFDFVSSGEIEISVSKDIRKNIDDLHKDSKYEYDAFFSYSSKDYEESKEICEKLRGYGLNIFLSGEALKSNIGTSFFDKIERALNSSQHFILLSTINSMDSEWVKTEYETFYNEYFIPSKGERKFLIVQGIGYNQESVPTLLRRLQIADSPKEIIDTFLKDKKLISEDIIDEKIDIVSKEESTIDKKKEEERVEIYDIFNDEKIDLEKVAKPKRSQEKKIEEKATKESEGQNLIIDKSKRRPLVNHGFPTRVEELIKSKYAKWLFLGLSLIFVLFLGIKYLVNTFETKPKSQTIPTINTDNSSKDGPIDIQIPNGPGPFFKWDKEGAVTGDGWNARRQAILDELKADEILEITGQYRADEVHSTMYENLGIARANDVAKLFMPPLTYDRIRLKGEPVNARVNDKTSLFKSIAFRNLKNTKTIKEIDDRTLLYFPFNSVDKLKDFEVEAYLNDVAERVKKSGERVRLTGHTDSVDSDAFNQALGMRRANIVKKYLISKGVNSSKIITQSKGEAQPIATNDTRAGRAQNRRTELEIIK